MVLALLLALALQLGVAVAARSLGQHSPDALVSAAGSLEPLSSQAAAPDADVAEAEARVLQAAGAAQTDPGKLSEAELEEEVIEAMEEAEEDGEFGDITQPEPAELAAHTGAAQTEPKAATQSAAATTGAKGFLPEAQAGVAETAKGVLPEDVEESIERAIDAHGSGSEAAASTAGSSSAGLEKPAGGGDALGSGGKGAGAAQEAAVTGGQGSGAGGSLTSADVAEEEAVLEALEEKLEEEPPPKDSAEAEERVEEEIEIAAEEGVLEAEAQELKQLEAPRSPAQQQQQQQAQQKGASQQQAQQAQAQQQQQAAAMQQQQQQRQGAGSSAGAAAVSAGKQAKTPAQAEGSLVQQGVILGGAIKDMVADNSTGIAGAVAVILAILAGVGVAVAGIALYQRMRRRRDGKPGPRIIEIGSLTGGRKSPTYARVGARNGDAEGSSGAPWKAWEERWEDDGRPQPPGTGASAATARNGGKQKKAWDWDEDW